MGPDATLATVTLTALLSIMLSASVAIVLCRRSARRLTTRFEQRLAAQKAEDAAVHSTERDSMAASAEQLTRAGYSYVERLHSEIVHLKQQYADGQLAHDAVVAELRDEIATLRARLASSDVTMDR